MRAKNIFHPLLNHWGFEMDFGGIFCKIFLSLDLPSYLNKVLIS